MSPLKIKRSERLKEHSFYLKENRELIGDTLLGVAGENLCDCIGICVPKFWGDVDLEKAEFSLAFHNPKDYFSEFMPSEVILGDEIKVYFGVGSEMCAVAGEVKIQLIARVGNEVVLKSKNAKMLVSESAIDEKEISSQFPSELSKKADKVLSPVGNIAGLDKDGNLCDSTYGVTEDDYGIYLQKNGVTALTLFEKTPPMETFSDVQKIVRDGRAQKYFKLGDLLEMKKNNETLYWEIIGFDKETPVDETLKHSITLMLRDIYSPFPADIYQTFYIADKEYPSGRYCFEISGNYYVFDMPCDIPENTTFTVSRDLSCVCAHTDNTYSSKIFENGMTLVDTIPENATLLTPTNDINWAFYGKNEYLTCAIKEWLNSDKAYWFKGADKWRREHTYAKTLKGFLYGMPEDFLNAVGQVKKKTLGIGGKITETDERFFILSRSEVSSTDRREGNFYEYLSTAESRKRTYNGAFKRWRLRTTRSSTVTSFWNIDQNGNINHGYTDNSDGVLPVCCIV